MGKGYGLQYNLEVSNDPWYECHIHVRLLPATNMVKLSHEPTVGLYKEIVFYM